MVGSRTQKKTIKHELYIYYFLMYAEGKSRGDRAPHKL